MLDAVLPTTAGVLCIESQAELSLVLARASGPIPQVATCRLRAVLVAAVSSRARRTGGTLHFYCPHPVLITVLYSACGDVRTSLCNLVSMRGCSEHGHTLLMHHIQCH